MLSELDQVLREQEKSVIATLKQKVGVLERRIEALDSEKGDLALQLERSAAESRGQSEALRAEREKTAKLERGFSGLFGENRRLLSALEALGTEAAELKLGFEAQVRVEREKAGQLETELGKLKGALEFLRRGAAAEARDSQRQRSEMAAAHERTLEQRREEVRGLKEAVAEKERALAQQAEAHRRAKEARDKEWAARVEERAEVLERVIKDLRRENRAQAERARESEERLRQESLRVAALEAEARKRGKDSRGEAQRRRSEERGDRAELESQVARKAEAVRKLERKLAQAKVG